MDELTLLTTRAVLLRAKTSFEKSAGPIDWLRNLYGATGRRHLAMQIGLPAAGGVALGAGYGALTPSTVNMLPSATPAAQPAPPVSPALTRSGVPAVQYRLDPTPTTEHGSLDNVVDRSVGSGATLRERIRNFAARQLAKPLGNFASNFHEQWGVK